jgi:hypothetical protein
LTLSSTPFLRLRFGAGSRNDLIAARGVYGKLVVCTVSKRFRVRSSLAEFIARRPGEAARVRPFVSDCINQNLKPGKGGLVEELSLPFVKLKVRGHVGTEGEGELVISSTSVAMFLR